jgi:hypothetical protein
MESCIDADRYGTGLIRGAVVSISDYEYPPEQCDVPEVRRPALAQYRIFRRKVLEQMRGAADTSVMNQVHDLAWHTAVFRTLNEARRIEPNRAVNGAMWELTTAGYASLMTLGIRKLVDKDPRTDSLWNVIALVGRRPELLTREKFVCYDGLPYDYEAVQQKYLDSIAGSGVRARWLPTKGPDAWAPSEMMHKAFDRLAGYPEKRKRTDTIDLSILDLLRERLAHPAIGKVCTMADRRVAHAERISEDSGPVPIATYNDIDTALQQIVYVANFLSASFFYDAAFGSVVPTPQFDVLEALDQPWVTTQNLPALHDHWHEVSNAMDAWANAAHDEFLPQRAGDAKVD